MTSIESAPSTDAERLLALTELEHFKSAAAAAQARITAALERSQRAQAPAHRTRAEISRSVSAQVALARQDSPFAGNQHLGVALALVHDLPFTMEALSQGILSERRAWHIVRETAMLSRDDRQQVDAELAGRLAGKGDRSVANLARGIAERLDPGAALQRNAKAERDRRISVRPAKDGMAWLGGLLPMVQGIAAYASLRKDAVRRRASGDLRTVDQIAADLMYERLTGRSVANGPAVEVQIVMSERSLVRGSHESATVTGFGSVPAFLARRLVREAHRAWIRRLYTRPDTGELVAMDSRRRAFEGKLRDLLVARDQICRTPWCDAPIAHADHPERSTDGGETSLDNGQGLCEACNYTKETGGWRHRVDTMRGHVVTLTTPLGETYESRPPPQPGAGPPGGPLDHLRRFLDDSA